MAMPEAARVIAGTARGLRLDGAPSGTRPLSDRVKQALFGALEAGSALSGPFLDLFAGTGAAGIEALSRGAPAATFVERDARACAAIQANIRRAGLDGGTVVRSDVVRFLASDPTDAQRPYAAVLVDPPYGETQLLRPTLELLADPARGWLSGGAVVVVKHFWRDAPAGALGDLVLDRVRRFGETMLSFYVHSAADEAEPR